VPTETEIRGAERARLEAIVAEHGTEGEQTQLLLSGMLRSGVTLGQYLGEEPLGRLAPEPELLARLARRVERREKAGLPAVACVHEPPNHACTCLEFSLDAAGGGGRRAILRRAAGFHWSPPPRTGRAKALTPVNSVVSAEEASEASPRLPPSRRLSRDLNASRRPAFSAVRASGSTPPMGLADSRRRSSDQREEHTWQLTKQAALQVRISRRLQHRGRSKHQRRP